MRTLGCNAEGTKLVAATSVSSDTKYSRNPDHFQSLNFAAFDGFYTDSDVGLTFQDDGRLSGVNATSNGQGGEIVKNGISMAAAFASLLLRNSAADDAKKKAIKDACDAINAHLSPADKTVTLTYVVNVFFKTREKPDHSSELLLQADTKNDIGYDDQLHRTINVRPDRDSEALDEELYHGRNTFTVNIVSAPILKRLTEWNGATTEHQPLGAVPIWLNDVAIAELSVEGPLKGPDGTLSGKGVIWSAEIPVPVTTIYPIPVPKGAFFGTEKFVLALSSYGTITKLEYGMNAGTASAMDAATNIAKVYDPSSPSQQAAALQGQSDLYYQQNRLVICQATPASCPSK